ncbi:MAG: hypothetical protein R3D32_06445 [Nitratireductor sp.]
MKIRLIALYLLLPLIVAANATPAFSDEVKLDGLTYDIGRNGVRAAFVISGNENDGYTAQFTLTENGGTVASLDFIDILAEYTLPQASFVEMDNSNDTMEVFVSQFTGGAHCCAEASVFTKSATGWNQLDFGAFDGGPEGIVPQDVDFDGVSEIVTYDNAFLYAFTSYAGSRAPRQILAIRNGEVANVSADPAFASVHRTYLEEMGTIPDAGTDTGSDRNSWLAAYAATLLLLGEPDPLDYADQSFDPDVDWDMSECADPALENDCPADKQVRITFPQALRKLLAGSGYPKLPE